jgi:hypothetical protein
MATTTTIQQRAAEAARWFETARRLDDAGGGTYIRLRDGRPEWVYELVQEAHGGMLPDDWRYAAIAAALEAMAEGHLVHADDDSEWADSHVDVNYGARIEWLGSHGSRPDYVDAATIELGAADGVLDAIAQGQFLEACEVYGLVWRALDELELEDEDEDDPS